MLPLLAADAQRLAEAQRTRPGGAPRGARGQVALLRAIVGGSLDRAMDVAATLEVRGFASARRAAAPVAPVVAPRRRLRSPPPPLCWRCAVCRAARRGGGLRRLPAELRRPSRRGRSRCAALAGRGRCCPSPTAAGSSHDRAAAVLRAASPTATRAAAGPALDRTSARRRARRVLRAGRPLGPRQVDAAARRLRPRAALPRRAFRGPRDARAGSTRASTGPRASARSPECCSRTRRRSW